MTDDNYQRTGAATTPAQLIGDLDIDFETLGHDAKWWAERDAEVQAALAQDAAARERERMAQRAGELRENGFPEMFIDSALGALADTEPMRLAQMFVHLPRKLLVLAGGVGAGKTTAATWVALKGQDPRPAFMRISELERRGRYDKRLDEWLKDKTSLVIDDVGAEFLDGKGAFRSLMDEVVDIFYSNRRRLVMTTNLRPRRKPAEERTKPEDHVEQFVERYGDRVWSRMNQIGMWADCGVRDLRKEKP